MDNYVFKVEDALKELRRIKKIALENKLTKVESDYGFCTMSYESIGNLFLIEFINCTQIGGITERILVNNLIANYEEICYTCYVVTPKIDYSDIKKRKVQKNAK